MGRLVMPDMVRDRFPSPKQMKPTEFSLSIWRQDEEEPHSYYSQRPTFYLKPRLPIFIFTVQLIMSIHPNVTDHSSEEHSNGGLVNTGKDSRKPEPGGRVSPFDFSRRNWWAFGGYFCIPLGHNYRLVWLLFRYVLVPSSSIIARSSVLCLFKNWFVIFKKICPALNADRLSNSLRHLPNFSILWLGQIILERIKTRNKKSYIVSLYHPILYFIFVTKDFHCQALFCKSEFAHMPSPLESLFLYFLTA